MMATAIDWTKTYFERHPIRIASSLNALGIETYNREVALDYLALGNGSKEISPSPEPATQPAFRPLPVASSVSPELVLEGDTVSVVEAHRQKYADLVDVSFLALLVVLKKVSGAGGGLIVKTEKGHRLKVAQCHVVKVFGEEPVSRIASTPPTET